MKMLSRLARLLYPYGAVRRVLRGPAAGVGFHVAPGMGLMYALGRDHERALKRLAGQLQTGGVFYDIGANQGQFSLALAQVVGREGLVMAVEPQPGNIQALEANLSLGSYPQVRRVKAAISAAGGIKTFCFDPGRNTMGTFADSTVKLDARDAASFSVETLTLDELFEQAGRSPDCIKIDVEGAADEVLGGAEKVIYSSRPRLLVELHLSDRHDRERLALMRFAEKFRYTISMFDGMPVEAERHPAEYQAWCVPCSVQPPASHLIS